MKGTIARVLSSTIKRVGTPLLSTDKYYWPGMGQWGKNCKLPDAKLWPLGLALLEVALNKSHKANELYNEIVQAFKTPEAIGAWQRVKWGILTNRPEAERILNASLASARGEKLTNAQRESFFDAVLDFMGNSEDMPEVLGAADRFILETFNQPEDIKFKRARVTLDPSTALSWAVLLRAFCDSKGINLKALERQRPGTVMPLFGQKPTTRAGRRRKTTVRKVYQVWGMGLVADETLMNGAEVWYMARVDPGNFAAVRNELQRFDNPSISHEIEPYNRASGYIKSQ